MKTIFLAILSLLYFSLFAQEKGVTPLKTQNSELKTSETYAVVVGISDYQDKDIPDLRFADRDAEAFANFLRSPAGGLLDGGHLKLLTNEDATGARFSLALDWLMEVAEDGDQAIIYFSGHGDVEAKRLSLPGYLLGWDAPSRVYMTGGTVNVRDLQDIISTLSVQKKAKVVVITDACHAGKLSGSEINGVQLTSANLAQQAANEIKILSCQSDEVSIEGEQWGGGRGAFSYNLVDALYGMADANNDLSVNLKEVGRYLEDHVTAEVAPVSQNPKVIGSPTERLATVDAKLLADLRSGRTSQMKMLSPIESRGMDDEVLAGVDTTTRELYRLFKKALQDKVFLSAPPGEPAAACADAYYERLMAEPKLARLYSTMTRNYAAALQDEAQQELNTMLKSGLTGFILNAANPGDVYEKYPAYLNRAAELLGKGHYMYTILQARKYFFEGQFAGSSPDMRIFYQKALQLQPDMAHAMVEIIYSSDANQLDSALYYFQRSTELVPSWVGPYIALSSFYLRQTKQIDKAEEMLRLADQVDSTSILVWYSKAQFYSEIGDYETAEKWYLKTIEASGEEICFPCAYLSLGNIYSKTRRYAEAEQVFQKAIQLDSSISKSFKSFCRPCAFYNLGNMFFSMRNNEKAMVYLQKVIQLDSTFANAYTKIGYLYLNNQRYEEAEQTFKKAIQLDSTDKWAYLNLGVVYGRTQRFAEAEQVYQKTIQLDSTFIYSYINLGFIYNKSGRYVETEKVLQKALQLDSSVTLAYNILGSMYYNTRRYDEAGQIFQKVLLLDSTDAPGWVNLGNVYRMTGHLDNAEAAYQKTLQLNNPIANPYAHRGLGICSMETGHFKESEDHFITAISLDSAGFVSQLYLGRLYLRMDRLSEAETQLMKALEMNSDFPDTYIYLAQLALKNKQLEQAWEYLIQGVEMGFGKKEGELTVDYLLKEPDFEQLRKEIRFEDLMKKYFPDQVKD